MSLGQIANNVRPEYEDYEPFFDWLEDSEDHMLYFKLPDFGREQLKVQITSSRIVKVSGERKTTHNKLLKFQKDLPIPNNADTSGIRAKFESGVLYIRFPKTDTKPTKQLEESPKKPQQLEQAPKLQEENKNKQLKDKEKIEAKDNVNESGEGTSSSKEGIMEKRTNTSEIVSRQTQEYKSAVYGLVEEFKKQKKLVNLVVVVLFVLVFVIYVNNAIKSYFGGSTKRQEL